jgi:hypothetical protein
VDTWAEASDRRGDVSARPERIAGGSAPRHCTEPAVHLTPPGGPRRAQGRWCGRRGGAGVRVPAHTPSSRSASCSGCLGQEDDGGCDPPRGRRPGGAAEGSVCEAHGSAAEGAGPRNGCCAQPRGQRTKRERGCRRACTLSSSPLLDAAAATGTAAIAGRRARRWGQGADRRSTDLRRSARACTATPSRRSRRTPHRPT